jgi:hypothetical protein
MRASSFALLLLGAAALERAAVGGGLLVETSATNKHAWSENAGWINFKSAHAPAQLHYDGSNSYLSGYAWAERLGWVKLGGGAGPYVNTTAANWGVNMDAAWNLAGYGWSENAGWVNFAPAHGGVAMDPVSGGLTGYVWGERVGWIHFTNAAPAYQVQAVIEKTTVGQVPYWWLWDYGATGDFEEAAMEDPDGDRMATWGEYVAGTRPDDGASYLGMRLPSAEEQLPPASGFKVEWLSVPGKQYQVERGSHLLATPPFGAVGPVIPAVADVTSYADTNAAGPGSYFYRVRVER